MEAGGRRRSWRSSGWLAVVMVLLVPGCGVAPDDPDSATGVEIETLVRRLPESTVSVMAIDAVSGADALGADPAALGRRADLPAAWGSDGPDPDGQLATALMAAITPLIAPLASAHDDIDLGEVTGVVRATTAQPHAGLIVFATALSSDELVGAYTDAGFQPADGDVLVHPDAAGGVSGGFDALGAGLVDEGFRVVEFPAGHRLVASTVTAIAGHPFLDETRQPHRGRARRLGNRLTDT